MKKPPLTAKEMATFTATYHEAWKRRENIELQEKLYGKEYADQIKLYLIDIFEKRKVNHGKKT